MPTVFRDVRQGQSGKHLLALSFSGFDPNRTSSDLTDGAAFDERRVAIRLPDAMYPERKS